jgi:hypothetical protein
MMAQKRSLVLILIVFLIIPATLAFSSGVFSGKWKGEWKNSLGESGPDSLVLKEHDNGLVKGLWTGEVEVSGSRINANSIQLRGKTATRSYQITATLDEDKDEMDLKYMVTRLNAEGSYYGSSKLYRVRGK